MAQKKTFPLRIDASLWDELQAWAADDLRSVNAQIEYLLREAIRARRRKAGRDIRTEQGKS
ncbi:MAG: hypothetical protein V2A58_09230 [Planctomycetota bacterium]